MKVLCSTRLQGQLLVATAIAGVVLGCVAVGIAGVVAQPSGIECFVLVHVLASLDLNVLVLRQVAFQNVRQIF